MSVADKTDEGVDLDRTIAFLENAKLATDLNDRPALHFHLAQAYTMKGMLVRARLELEEGLKLQPDDEDFKRALETIYLSLN